MDDFCSSGASKLKSMLNTLCIFESEREIYYLVGSGVVFLVSASIELYLFRLS